MAQCDKCGGCGEVQTPLSIAVEELINKARNAIEYVGAANYDERIYKAHTWVTEAAQDARKLVKEMEAWDVS